MVGVEMGSRVSPRGGGTARAGGGLGRDMAVRLRAGGGN